MSAVSETEAGRVAADGLPEAIGSVDAAKLLLSVCRKSRGGGGTEAGAAGGPPSAGAVEAGADEEGSKEGKGR